MRKKILTIFIATLPLVLAFAPATFAGDGDCVAPPGANLEGYPVLEGREMTPETAAKMGLRLEPLTEPWEGFNWYGGRHCYQYERLRVGTKVYVDSDGEVRYKADCSNRLISLRDCPTCVIQSPGTPGWNGPMIIQVVGQDNDVNVVVGDSNSNIGKPRTSSGSLPDPYFGNEEGQGESDLVAMSVGSAPLIGAGCGIFAACVLFLVLLAFLIWGIVAFFRRRRNQTNPDAPATGGDTTAPPQVPTPTGASGGATTPPQTAPTTGDGTTP